MKLTKETFLELTPDVKRFSIDGYPDLYCEPNMSGYTFQIRYKSPSTGKIRFAKLQTFKYDSIINKKVLDNIVRQFILKQGDVIKGIDLIDQKRASAAKTKASKVGMVTGSDLFDQYTELRLFKSLSKSTRSGYLGSNKNHVFPKFGKRDIKSITSEEVEDWFESIDSDSVHNGSLVVMLKIQKMALKKKLIKAPFLFDVKARPMGKKNKTLTDKEIVLLMGSDFGWDGLRNAAKFQLLTGCRISEVTGARHEEFQNSVWTIPASRIKTERGYKKQSRPHCIPITPKMAEIILQQRQHGGKGLVFKKQQEGKHLDRGYFPSSIARWLELIGIEGGTHQLRHTIESRVSEMESISELDLKLITNHTLSGQTANYVHSQQIERKRGLYLRWHQLMDDLMTQQAKEAI